MGETHDAAPELGEPVLAVLEGLPDATVAAGPDGRMVFVNELAAELFGYTREDEFVVVCEDVDCEAATALGRRMERALRQPLAVDGAEHRLTASIGIALGDDDADGLPARADAAVYRAKAAGRGRVEVWCA